MDWYEIKHAVEVFTGLNEDALHVHVGVLAQLLAAFLLRRSVASPWPWLFLLLAVGANEWFDLNYETWPGSERDRQFEESIRDAWNTMLIPTLLLLLSRCAPRLLVPPAAEPELPA
jgi:hypothetical protein